MNDGLFMIRLFSCLLLLVMTDSLKGQASHNGGAVSADADPRVKNLYSLYYQHVSSPNELINGKEYIPYSFYSKTSPMLFSGVIFTATLKIKGREYHNVRLQYDTFLDELIYTDTSRVIDDTYRRIALNKDIVDGFDFAFRSDSLKFRNLTFGQSGMKNGFYEIVYNGKAKFIIRHESSQYIYDAVKEYKYRPVSYVLSGGKQFVIKDNKSLLTALGQNQWELKKYLKESRINIKRAGKNEIVRVMTFFDSLQKSQAALQ